MKKCYIAGKIGDFINDWASSNITELTGGKEEAKIDAVKPYSVNDLCTCVKHTSCDCYHDNECSDCGKKNKII